MPRRPSLEPYAGAVSTHESELASDAQQIQGGVLVGRRVAWRHHERPSERHPRPNSIGVGSRFDSFVVSILIFNLELSKVTDPVDDLPLTDRECACESEALENPAAFRRRRV